MRLLAPLTYAQCRYLNKGHVGGSFVNKWKKKGETERKHNDNPLDWIRASTLHLIESIPQYNKSLSSISSNTFSASTKLIFHVYS